MAERIPLVLVNGVHRQIDPADTIPASNVPNGISAAQAAKLAAFTQDQATQLGALEFSVANNFNPMVTGLSAPVFSRAATLDGTKGWVKWGSADNQWSPLHTMSAAFGSNLATWDSTALLASLACDTNPPKAIRITGSVSGACDLNLRINGANATTRWLVMDYSGNAGSAFANAYNYVTFGSASDFCILIEFLQGKSGNNAQSFRVFSSFTDGSGPAGLFGIFVNTAEMPQAEITSIGLHADSACTMGATSVATLIY